MRGPDPHCTNLSRKLRRDQSSAEQRLWRVIRNRQLGGLKFVRQMAVGPYIADFACRRKRLIVEIDGATHSSDEELAHDARRDAFLRSAGYEILRFRNTEVYEALDMVCEAILARAAAHPLSPRGARGEGQGEGPGALSKLGGRLTWRHRRGPSS
jgi:very-short-patch-repair endonuclease